MIEQQIEEVRKYWQELWWAVSGGVMSEYERLQNLDIVEFWALVGLWEEKINREIDAYKNRAGK